MRRAVTAALAGGLMLVLAACGTAGSQQGAAGIQPVDGRSGLKLTGTVGGRQLVVNDGAPTLRVGDCDVNDGPDVDVCFFSRDIDGRFFAIVIENPDVLEPDTTVDVVASSCASPGCDDVTDGAVVDVGFAADERRVRATGGTLAMRTVEPGQRYSGRLTLRLPDGRISGTFEVVPRPDDEG